MTGLWRIQLKLRTGWSSEIINAIRTREEAEIYVRAGLREALVGGKVALIQPRIVADQLTPEWYIRHYGRESWRGWTNSDLMGEGFAPFSWPTVPGTEEGTDPMELHHIGQRQDSPYAELTWAEHHGGDNFATLHTFDDSEIERQQFAAERTAYWKARFLIEK